jgi:uncharacterized protein with PIN domain
MRKSRSRSGVLAAEATLVFDACAVIAMLRGEEGAESVAALLEDPKRYLSGAVHPVTSGLTAVAVRHPL